jgi:N-acetylmuramoyl-L-alanine amidase
MRIKNHRLFDDAGGPVSFVESPNRGGVLVPRFLVMHFTAGASAASSIDHLTRRGAGASAHLVIGRGGATTQLVPFNRVAWHAGTSRWQGVSGLNRHSIGIELDNAGELTDTPAGWTSWFGRVYPDEDVVIAAHKHDGVESGWQRYPEAQIMAALAASEAIFAQYGLEDVLGHDDIAPERKRDPGPAFPLERFAGRLRGRADDDFPLYETISWLNIREEPGTGHALLPEAPLAVGTRLLLVARDGSWCRVDVLGENDNPVASGWVHGDYIRRIVAAGGTGTG